MSQTNPERRPNSEFHESDRLSFSDKFRGLLPGIAFETSEYAMLDAARTAAIEALVRNGQDTDFLQIVWREYAAVWEQTIDSKTLGDTNPQNRAGLQVAAAVHKALIFREVGDIQRYNEELVDAEEYAFNTGLDEVAEIIGIELDGLAGNDL